MRYQPEGSILILVMWVLLLLSIFTLSVGYSAQQRLRLLDRLESREKLRAAADAGVRAAVAVIRQKSLKTQNVDALNESWSRNEGSRKAVEVGTGIFFSEIVDEERKINLNEIKSALVLTRLFEEAARMDEQSASNLAAAILDWRDEDDDPYESGAESRYYQSLHPAYVSKNSSLGSLEELLYVRGMTPGLLKEIRPFVSVSGNPRINLNTVPKEVMLALGFSESLVKAILAFRGGRDQQAGTRDDNVFMDLSLAAEALEKSGYGGAAEKQELGNWAQSGKLDIHSDHFAIESRARLPYSQELLTVRCIVKRNVGITGWMEEYSVLPEKNGVLK